MKKVIKENLQQLTDLLNSISEQQYTKQIEILSDSTIGQHFRHIIEFYKTILNATSNSVCYDNRKRDKRIENSPAFTIKTIELILLEVEQLNENQLLCLEADFTEDGSGKKQIKSSAAREMAYCLEHSIHHQALIKAGLISMNLKQLVNDKFGVAYSTIQFQNNICAQ
ncbi:MAG: DinB family protein [Bacteroidetes bacterium]|nr:DinB family protein [Bacteroidota bacterium]